MNWIFGSGEHDLKKFKEPDEQKAQQKKSIVNVLNGLHSILLLLKIIVFPHLNFYYTPKTQEPGNMRQRILALYQQNEGRNGYRMIWRKLRKEEIFLSGKMVLVNRRALGFVLVWKWKDVRQRGKRAIWQRIYSNATLMRRSWRRNGWGMLLNFGWGVRNFIFLLWWI